MKGRFSPMTYCVTTTIRLFLRLLTNFSKRKLTGGVTVTFSVQPVSVIKPPPAREGALRFRSITQMLEHKHRASVGEQPKLYTKPIIRN